MDLPEAGVFHNCAILAIRKSYPQHARKVMHAVWGMGQMQFTKTVVVVDADVDVHDYAQVAWRAFNNVDPQRDVVVTRGRWTRWTTRRRSPTGAPRWASTPRASGRRRGIRGSGRPTWPCRPRSWPASTRAGPSSGWDPAAVALGGDPAGGGAVQPPSGPVAAPRSSRPPPAIATGAGSRAGVARLDESAAGLS